MKVLRNILKTKAKSYDCKYAVEMVFQINEASRVNIGKSLAEVLEYNTIRGMFDTHAVHDDLKDLGVDEIVLNDKNIFFKGNFI